MDASSQSSASTPQSPARRGPYMNDGGPAFASILAGIKARHGARFGSASRGASPSNSEESSIVRLPIEELNRDAQGSDRSHNDMEDDDTAVGRSEKGEAEDQEMGDDDEVDDGSIESSDGEESDGEPLKAESRWPFRPSRRSILRLAECSGLDDDVASGEMPAPTAQSTIRSALASIEFLESLKGAVLDPNNFGIDHAGRLFETVPGQFHFNYRRNYRCEFSDMRSALLKKAHDESVKKVVKKNMQAYVDVGNAGVLEESAEEELGDLLSLVENAMRQNDFGVPKLKPVLAECEKAVARMGKTVALVNAVKQDLLDTRSTSLKRWKELQSFGVPRGWRVEGMAGGLPDLSTAESIDLFIGVMARDASSYHEAYGLTLKLRRELDYAIGELSSYV